MAQISIEDVEHVAQLARLELSDAEKQKFTQELGEILNFVDELTASATSKVAAIGQIANLSNIARADKITNQENRDKMLQNAPEKKDGFIVVKKIFE